MPVPSCGSLLVGDILPVLDAEIDHHKQQLSFPKELLDSLGLAPGASLSQILSALVTKNQALQQTIDNQNKKLTAEALMSLVTSVDAGCLSGACGPGTTTLKGVLSSLVGEVCRLRDLVSAPSYSASTLTYLPNE
ncbi:hypothetical protein [Spirosoma terrae]|uniref:Uncharacterized protein n=1 Tax=Spirosoma terrae TaxID=1968276 RepID=A0A6L9L5R2_9BACT|nr:hypothetical protein [Spirosoma terrae]NDU95740.1 hypothetical protein [Spirosoma terrae]